MADIQDLFLFIGLSWILIITPGPDLFYVLTKGISTGKKAGLISAIGVSLGVFVHTIFAALGLSVILKTSALAFMILKIVGAGYLIFLGIKTLISKDKLNLTKEKKNLDQENFYTRTSFKYFESESCPLFYGFFATVY